MEKLFISEIIFILLLPLVILIIMTLWSDKFRNNKITTPLIFTYLILLIVFLAYCIMVAPCTDYPLRNKPCHEWKRQ